MWPPWRLLAALLVGASGLAVAGSLVEGQASVSRPSAIPLLAAPTPTPTITPTPTGTGTPLAVGVEVHAFPLEDADPWLLAPNPSSLGVAFTAYQANRVGVLTYTLQGTPANVVQFDLTNPAIPGPGPWDVMWRGQELWFTEEQANKVARP